MRFDHPVLTLSEERELGRLIEAGVAAAAVLGGAPDAPRVAATGAELERLVAAGEEARTTFLLANCRLVVVIAHELARRHGLDAEELFQEGSVALAQALARFDHARGVPFCTVAGRWIRSRLADHVATRCGTRHLPGWAVRRNVAWRSVSWDAVGDVAEAEPDVEPDLDALLSLLPEEECQVVIARFLHGLTLTATGERLGMGATTVRRTQERALARMRTAGLADAA